MPAPTSSILDCACAACGADYPASGFPAVCPLCGGFWEHGDGFGWRPPAAGTADGGGAGSGLRRWAPALGLDPAELPGRPLSSPPGLYVMAGETELEGRAREVWICQQGSAPIGSYKERGAEVMAAAALRRGVRELFLDSSGNAGIAVSRAAAARGIRCHVLVPATTPAQKVERIRAAGGQVEVVPGDRDATHRAAQQWRQRLPYAAPFFQPSFLAGVATLAWDLAADLGRPLPDHWLLPAGNGPLLLGLALGLRCLERAGVVDRLPALHAVQLEGYASLSPDGPGERPDGPPIASGIAIAQPPRRTDMRRAITGSGGGVTRVGEQEIAAARRELAERGWTADATGAAAFAGFRRHAERRGAGADPPQAWLVIVTSREEVENS